MLPNSTPQRPPPLSAFTRLDAPSGRCRVDPAMGPGKPTGATASPSHSPHAGLSLGSAPASFALAPTQNTIQTQSFTFASSRPSTNDLVFASLSNNQSAQLNNEKSTASGPSMNRGVPPDNLFMQMKDERDSLTQTYIRQKKMADPDAKYNLGKEPQFVPECMDMCPLFERHEREYQNGLIRFEMVLL